MNVEQRRLHLGSFKTDGFKTELVFRSYGNFRMKESRIIRRFSYVTIAAIASSSRIIALKQRVARDRPSNYRGSLVGEISGEQRYLGKRFARPVSYPCNIRREFINIIYERYVDYRTIA